MHGISASDGCEVAAVLWVGQPRTEVSFRTNCGFDEITEEKRRNFTAQAAQTPSREVTDWSVQEAQPVTALQTGDQEGWTALKSLSEDRKKKRDMRQGYSLQEKHVTLQKGSF